MPDKSLYFIAIIPPGPIADQLLILKQEVATRFNSRAALRSPPHLTLHMPFKWPDKKMPKLSTALTGFFSQYRPVPIVLDGFGAFEPRVIYVQVRPEQNLSTMQQQLGRMMAESLSIHNINYRNQSFHPHITIAFRDLKKAYFLRAWQYYQNQNFTGNFLAEQVVLLKHNGRIWEQVQTFNLAK